MVARLTSALAVLLIGAHSFAHTPHHVVDDLAVSPDYEADSTVYVLVHNSLLRSGDGGASWKQLVNGIETPYVLTDVTISPEFRSDRLMFVASDGGGIYRSADGGDTWSAFNSGLPHRAIGKLFLAGNAEGQALLAAGSTRGLFVSSSQTADWRRVLSDDVQVTALMPLPGGAVLVGDAAGGLWQSDASFEEWRRVTRLADAGAVRTIASDRRRGLLVGTENAGLLSMTAEGASIESLSEDWNNPIAHVVDIHVSDDGETVLATTWDSALQVSRDAGVSWQLHSRSLRKDRQAEQFGTPNFRNIEVGGQHWFLASFDGLYRSEDEGRSWTAMETMPVSLIRGLAVSPENRIHVSTYGGGAYLSSDQGATWQIVNHGLATTRLADAAFAPDGELFALARQRLLRRDPDAQSWTAVPLAYSGWRRTAANVLAKLPGVDRDRAYDLMLDATERGSPWPMQIALSPAYALDQTLFLGFRRHGVWASTDGGIDWNRGWWGPRDYVTGLVVSPDFGNDRTVFAAVRGTGVLVTRDAAGSWQYASKGLHAPVVGERATVPNHYVDPPLSRALSDVVLAISPDYASTSTLYAGSAAGLYRSVDAGRTWQRKLEGAVVALGMAPASGGEALIASIKGRGLLRSLDGGETFEPIARDLLRDNVGIRYIRISPDGTIYAASERDLYISRDDGSSWTRTDRPARYEDWRGSSDGPVWFTGGWRREHGTDYSASTQTVSTQPGDSAALDFTGRTVSWYGERGPSGGMARIVIDGNDAGIADLYAPELTSNVEVFTQSGLSDMPHRIVIEVLDRNNEDSAGRRVSVDSIDISGR